MQKQLYIAVTLLSIWCSSCKQQEAAPHFVSNAKQDTITSIFTDVKMVKINGGDYKPFYGSNTALVKVAPFLVDERQVTNAEFLAFVKANPQWQKSNVKQHYPKMLSLTHRLLMYLGSQLKHTQTQPKNACLH